MASLQSFVRFLLPKETHWYDMLEELAKLGLEASTALHTFKDQPASKVRESVQAIEHRADDVVRKMEDALARTFVTPLDREDLHRLTSELDDIVDFCNLSARCFNLYHLERPTAAMVQLMEKLEACTKIIAETVPLLRTHEYDNLLEGGRKVRKLEKEADSIYREAISSAVLGLAPATSATCSSRRKRSTTSRTPSTTATTWPTCSPTWP